MHFPPSKCEALALAVCFFFVAHGNSVRCGFPSTFWWYRSGELRPSPVTTSPVTVRRARNAHVACWGCLAKLQRRHRRSIRMRLEI